MEITGAHLRYLLVIYELMQKKLDVGAADVAKSMGVSKPSVTRMLGILMDKGMLVKERYGKIYLTDTGFLLARDYTRCVYALKDRVPCMGLDLTEEELLEAACLLAASLPERIRRRLVRREAAGIGAPDAAKEP